MQALPGPAAASRAPDRLARAGPRSGSSTTQPGTCEVPPIDEYVYLGQGWGERSRAAPALLLHAAGHVPEGPALPLVRGPGAALGQAAVRRSRAHAGLRLHRRPRADRRPTPTGCRSASRGTSTATWARTCSTSPAPPATRARSMHRDGQRYAIRIDGGPATHALTSMRLGDFGPSLARLAGEHVPQSPEVRPLRAAGARRGLSRGQGRAARATCARSWAPSLRQALDRPLAAPLSRRGGLRAHRRAGPHLEHGLRRRARPANYRVGNAPVSYPVPLEHLEVRLGAVQRLGEPAHGAQPGRVAGGRGAAPPGSTPTAGPCRPRSASARRPSIDNLAEHRDDAAAAQAAALARGPAGTDRPRQGRAGPGLFERHCRIATACARRTRRPRRPWRPCADRRPPVDPDDAAVAAIGTDPRRR